MLQTQFLLVNAHFTINLLVALVCFAVAWLYFDAWLGRRDTREGTKMLGFLLMSISFVIHSTQIEQSLLDTPILDPVTIDFVSGIARAAGYIVLIIGQLVDPLQPLPTYRAGVTKGFGIKNKKSAVNALLIFGSIPLLEFTNYLFPILAIITGFLYLRRATLGLEFHLRTIGYSFTLLSVSELLNLAISFRGSDYINLERLVQPFGILWIVEHSLLFLFIFILGKWVWSYLAKRLETQMFMIFTSVTLTIFLLTAVFFTSVSLNNLRNDILTNMEINVKVLEYTIQSRKDETLSDSQVFAQNPELINALTNADRKTLSDIAIALLLTKKQDNMIITDKNGAIILRADDPEKLGGSISDDPIIKRALTGSSASGIVIKEGVMAPTISVRAASPIRSGDELIGAIITGTNIDNAFVDGLKNATGLDASIYGDNVRSATTFIAPDGKSRWVGIQETTDEILEKVMGDGDIFKGSVSILNVPYLSAFTPIRDIDENVIGMFFVGRPEVSTLKAASELIEQTFLVTVILLIFSIIPSYFVSKYIVNQIR